LDQKRAGERIAFVPTMGALHKGHLALLRDGRRRADKLVLSIFVNPTQFGPNEDLEKYPKDLEDDLAKAKQCEVDAVFLPTNDIMYPKGCQTYVTVEEVTKNLCGGARPTHFRGVATVVAKLFNIVHPDVAIFGEKDYQQLVVIRRMAWDLSMPVEIVGHPIVREDDGLAMSSRNKYLSPEEREAALSLNQSLKLAQRLIDEGETNTNKILKTVSERIESTSILKIDYARLVDANTLEDLKELRRPALLAIAAQVGPARLIDNCLLK